MWPTPACWVRSPPPMASTGAPSRRERAQVEAEWQEGRDRGVIGSPHFFLGDTDVFCPTLRISHTEDHFDIEVATVELEGVHGPLLRLNQATSTAGAANWAL